MSATTRNHEYNRTVNLEALREAGHRLGGPAPFQGLFFEPPSDDEVTRLRKFAKACLAGCNAPCSPEDLVQDALLTLMERRTTQYPIREAMRIVKKRARRYWRRENGREGNERPTNEGHHTVSFDIELHDVPSDENALETLIQAEESREEIEFATWLASALLVESANDPVAYAIIEAFQDGIDTRSEICDEVGIDALEYQAAIERLKYRAKSF